MVNSKTVKKMKTRNFIAFIATGVALMASLGSCTKEFDKVDEPGNDVVTVVTAGISDADTKTYMGAAEEGKRKVYWENGDAISINGVSSAALAGVGADAATANFNFEGALETPYMAVYPATIWKGFDEDETHKYLVTLPREQISSHTAKASFAQNALPMAAYSAEGGNLQFKHLCAVVKLSLTGDKEISYVEFRGNNGEKVSGDFILFDDPENKPLALTFVGAAAPDKVVKVNVGKTLSGTATDIFVTVPAGEFSQGFTFRVVDSENHFMEIGTSKSRSLTAGLVANMDAVAYKPSTDPIDVVNISTAEQLVDFAKKYNSGYYTSVGKDLKVNLISDITFDEMTSAEFESITGPSGVGVLGTFDGKGFSIKNYTGSKPIFAYVAASGKPTEGTLSNLTLDESCVFTVSTDKSFAPMVASNFGTIDNCHSNATVNVSGTLASDLNIGGLVERNRNATALIRECSFEGKITFIVTQSAKANIYIGGLAGTSTGQISACTSSGELSVKNRTSTRDARYHMGGVIGKNEKGTVTESYNTGTISAETYRDYVYAGGVVGWNTGSLTDCGNTGSVKLLYYPTTTYIGGVCGYNEGTNIDRVSNSGMLVRDDQPAFGDHCVGGLIGYNDVVISGQPTMVNEGTIDLTNFVKANARITKLYVGGIVGQAASEFDYTNCSNTTTIPEKDDWQRGNIVGGPTPVN